MDKPRKIEIASPVHLLLLKTTDDKFLLINELGQSRVADEGRGLLRIIKEIFNIDAHIS